MNFIERLFFPLSKQVEILRGRINTIMTNRLPVDVHCELHNANVGCYDFYGNLQIPTDKKVLRKIRNQQLQALKSYKRYLKTPRENLEQYAGFFKQVGMKN